MSLESLFNCFKSCVTCCSSCVHIYIYIYTYIHKRVYIYCTQKNMWMISGLSRRVIRVIWAIRAVPLGGLSNL